jgi:hypothetical protein
VPTLQQVTNAGDTTTRTINANRLATSTTLRMNGLTADPSGVQAGDQWYRSSDQRFVAQHTVAVPVSRGGMVFSPEPGGLNPTTVPGFDTYVIDATDFNIEKSIINSLPLGQTRSFRIRIGMEIDQTASPGTASPSLLLGDSGQEIELRGALAWPWPQLSSADYAMYSVEYTITTDGTNVWYTGFVASDAGQVIGYAGSSNAGSFSNGLSGRVRWYNGGNGEVTVTVKALTVEVLD